MPELPHGTGLINYNKYVLFIVQVGHWSEMLSGKKCLSSCTRQENPAEISYFKFPNKMFLYSEDVIQLIRKLAMLCNSSTLIYGPKRALLDAQYPELCPLFDLFGESAVAEINIELGTQKFYESLGLDDTTLATFQQQLMSYASENLIKINAFLDSPYLSKFETDEVVVSVEKI